MHVESPAHPRPFPLLASLLLALAPVLAAGCGPPADADPALEAAQERAPNTLTAEERADGWRLLFDGRTTEGWRGFRRDHVPEGWQVVDDALTRVSDGAGDLITVDQFADFELALEWKVGPRGNSGVFFRATEDVPVIYEGAPEVQVLDDELHPDGRSQLTAAGSNYGLHPAPEGVVRPAGEWNQFRIIVRGAHVEQWMNGVQVVQYELWSPDWERRVQESKFAAWPEYGRATRGHIGVQDHGDPVWFRNVRLRELR